MNPKVTIANIADALGIATSTVSRALKNNPNISAAVKEKVWETAKKMGYSNTIVLNEPNIVAVIVPELNNFFYSEILWALQNKINIVDNPVAVYCSYNSFATEKKIVANLDANQVCCLIISQSMDAVGCDHLKELESRGTHVIMFNRVDYDFECPKFVVDNYMDSYRATNHLISAGYKRIAFAAKHYDCKIYKERVQAYKDTLIKNDIQFDPELLMYSELTYDDTYEVITRFLNLHDMPDALILPNYLAAMQASYIAKIKNIKIPEQLAIFSFDEEPYSKFSNPSISGIQRPLTEMGSAIAVLVQKIIDKKKYNKEKTTIFSSNLIIRASSLSRK